MSRFCLCLSLAALCIGAMADHVFTNWSWGQWTITTGEELWCGRRHEGYPVQNMFDGTMRTAWVYSGAWGDYASADYGPDGKAIFSKIRSIEDRYWVHIESSNPLWVDEIRVTNGYCKDSFTYGRNARIRTLEIHDREWPGTYQLSQAVKRVSLSDQMGLQVIKLPARKWNGILLVTTALNPGTDPDVAISELKLFYKGKDVTPRLKEYCLFSPGDECGCGGTEYLLDSRGRVLAESGSEARFAAESPSGRYFAGVNYDSEPTELGRWQFWVFDTTRKRLIIDKKWIEAPRLIDGRMFWGKRDRLMTGIEGDAQSTWKLIWDPKNGLCRELR